MLAVIPEPADEDGSGVVGVRKEKMRARPGRPVAVRRAHSSSEVVTVSKPAVEAPTQAPVVPAPAPATPTPVKEKEKKAKGRHVAWLPVSIAGVTTTSATTSATTSTDTISAPKTSPKRRKDTTPRPSILRAPVPQPSPSPSPAPQVISLIPTPTPAPPPSAAPASSSSGASTKSGQSKQSPTKKKQPRRESRDAGSHTFMLYGGRQPGRPSLREVLRQTLGGDSDFDDEVEEEDEDAENSTPSAGALSSPSVYEGDSDHLHRSLPIPIEDVPPPVIPVPGPDFPASPKVDRPEFGRFAPLLTKSWSSSRVATQFGSGNLSLLNRAGPSGSGVSKGDGNGSRTMPSSPKLGTVGLPGPAALHQQQQQPKSKPTSPARRPLPAHTRQEPVTAAPPHRTPSTAELNKVRASAYQASARHEDELAAARRRLAAAAAEDARGGAVVGKNPFAPYGAGVEGAGAGVVGAGEMADPPAYAGVGAGAKTGRTAARRDLVKPAYAMTFSTF